MCVCISKSTKHEPRGGLWFSREWYKVIGSCPRAGSPLPLTEKMQAKVDEAHDSSAGGGENNLQFKSPKFIESNRKALSCMRVFGGGELKWPVDQIRLSWNFSSTWPLMLQIHMRESVCVYGAAFPVRLLPFKAADQHRFHLLQFSSLREAVIVSWHII